MATSPPGTTKPTSTSSSSSSPALLLAPPFTTMANSSCPGVPNNNNNNNDDDGDDGDESVGSVEIMFHSSHDDDNDDDDDNDFKDNNGTNIVTTNDNDNDIDIEEDDSLGSFIGDLVSSIEPPSTVVESKIQMSRPTRERSNANKRVEFVDYYDEYEYKHYGSTATTTTATTIQDDTPSSSRENNKIPTLLQGTIAIPDNFHQAHISALDMGWNHDDDDDDDDGDGGETRFPHLKSHRRSSAPDTLERPKESQRHSSSPPPPLPQTEKQKQKQQQKEETIATTMPKFRKSLSMPQQQSGNSNINRRRRSNNNQLSRSTLVARNSAIDASWFASRGLMSQESFKVYKKELRRSVSLEAGGLYGDDDDNDDADCDADCDDDNDNAEFSSEPYGTIAVTHRRNSAPDTMDHPLSTTNLDAEGESMSKQASFQQDLSENTETEDSICLGFIKDGPNPIVGGTIGVDENLKNAGMVSSLDLDWQQSCSGQLLGMDAIMDGSDNEEEEEEENHSGPNAIHDFKGANIHHNEENNTHPPHVHKDHSSKGGLTDLVHLLESYDDQMKCAALSSLLSAMLLENAGSASLAASIDLSSTEVSLLKKVVDRLSPNQFIESKNSSTDGQGRLSHDSVQCNPNNEEENGSVVNNASDHRLPEPLNDQDKTENFFLSIEKPSMERGTLTSELSMDPQDFDEATSCNYENEKDESETGSSVLLDTTALRRGNTLTSELTMPEDENTRDIPISENSATVLAREFGNDTSSYENSAQADDTMKLIPKRDLLHEGMDHLSMVMFCCIYRKLREMSILGHAGVKLIDIDVNSHQSMAREREMRRLGLISENDEPKGFLESTRTAAFVVRTVLDEYDMFATSNNICALNQAQQAHMEYDASLLEEFKLWVEESKAKQLDHATEDVIQKLRERCLTLRGTNKRESSSKSLQTTSSADDVEAAIAKDRKENMNKSQSFQNLGWLQREQRLIEEHFGIRGDEECDENNSKWKAERISRRKGKGVITKELIEHTVDESSSCYFERGSIMRNLIDGGFEVVWFSDRHPNDVIYCIGVNRQTMTVTVVLHGRESFFNLYRDTAMQEHDNPIAHEDYDGNSEFIKLRSAVSDLLRPRRDTGESTIDEIYVKVDAIGRELSNGGKYHLTIAGHALGGGFATVVGYYLAADPGLDLASAIRVFSFASPRVGCERFQKGFMHLEETGRLMHARFTNSNDLMSFLPIKALTKGGDLDDYYKHVGMHICLHTSGNAGMKRTHQALDISYNQNLGILKEAVKFGTDFLLEFKLKHFLASEKNFRLNTFQRRMHFAREYRLALGDRVDAPNNNGKCLTTLDECYRKFSTCHDTDQSSNNSKMSLILRYLVVTFLISLEIALLLRQFISMREAAT